MLWAFVGLKNQPFLTTVSTIELFFLISACRALVHIYTLPIVASPDPIKLDNHQICTISGVNPQRCYVLCRFKQPGCKSFNYDVQGKRCELNDATADEFPLDVRQESGVNYFGLEVSWRGVKSISGWGIGTRREKIT